MRWFQRCGLAAVLSCCALNAAPATRTQPDTGAWLSIRWPTNTSGSPYSIEVSGLDAQNLQELRRSKWDAAQWQQLLAVHAEQGDGISNIGLPPMIGTHRVVDSTLRFEPQFPLELGVTYRATFRPALLPSKGRQAGLMMTSTFRMPAHAENPTTFVREVFPSASVLPENLLKFYVHFSAPMSRGHIYDYIHLRDAAGKAVELPFLEIGEELWDPTMTRVTLIIDPGRIKRGVRPLEEIGPALEAGKRFTFAIDAAWKDSGGNSLRAPFQKSFEVGPPDRQPPDPAAWKLQPPRLGTREPLVVQFPEPMEHALAERMIHVTTESGSAIAGKVSLDDHERRWTFVPAEDWRERSSKLVVETIIEDLAGNNIGKPFEVDLVEPTRRQLNRPTIVLSFTLR